MKKHFSPAIFALLICAVLILGLSACGKPAEATPTPLPEETSQPETVEEPAPSVQEPQAEDANPPLGFVEPEWIIRENAILEESYQKLMESREELLALLNGRLLAFREGTFEEMPNHHAPWREDFPSPQEVTYPLTHSDYVVRLVRYEALDEATTKDGELTVWVKLDEQGYWMVLTPAWFGSNESDEATLGFSDSGFYKGTPPGDFDFEGWQSLQNPQ